MSSPPLASRRPEILLGILLSACLAALSLQVRRPDGDTVGERWLQSALSPFVEIVGAVRSGGASVATWSATRRTLLSENERLRSSVESLEAELLRLRGVEHDRDRLLALFGSYPAPPSGTLPARLVA